MLVFGPGGTSDNSQNQESKSDTGNLPEQILQEVRHQNKLLVDLARGQEKFLAKGSSAPEQTASDDDARRLFAMVKIFQSKAKHRKAQILTVFLLYCLEGKSRNEIAKACHCSPSLITLRLQALEKELGRKPSELRSLSDQFELIADSLTDSRARRIDRRRAIDGSNPEDDD